MKQKLKITAASVEPGFPIAGVEGLYSRIRAIWEASRTQAARSVNTGHVCANWMTGREIVEEEQRGAQRAEYGVELIEQLSLRLKKEYGEGFSITALKYMRAFYLTYPRLLGIRHAVRDESRNTLPENELQIGHALRDQLTDLRKETWQPGRLHSQLSWMHYRTLLRVEREDVRELLRSRDNRSR